MFNYEILRNRWVIFVLFAGLALVFYVILYLIDYDRPRKRKEDDPEEYDSEYMNANEATPWALKVLVIAIFIFGIIFTLHVIEHPSSW